MKTTSLESDANSSMKLGSSYCVHKNFWYSQAWSLSQHHKNWRIIWGSHDIENRTAHEVTFETDCTRSCNRNRIFWGKICGLRAVHASSAFFPHAGHFPLSVHWTVHWWKFPRKLCGRKWLDCSARKFCNRNRKICSSSRKFFAVAGSRALESILACKMRLREKCGIACSQSKDGEWQYTLISSNGERLSKKFSRSANIQLMKAWEKS